MTHTCYCGRVYECPYCGTPDSYICPTLNEGGGSCEDCLAEMLNDESIDDLYDGEEDV